MMGRYSAVEVIACMFRTGINWGRPIAPGRLIPHAIPYTAILHNNMNFKLESIKKTIRHCCFLHTLQTHIGHVIIPKPHFSSREGINSRYRRFELLHSPFWFNLSPP